MTCGTGFYLRTARPADAEAVTGLLAASYPPLMAPAYDDAVLAVALPLMTRANPDLLSGGTFHLAEGGDGRLAGCGGWTMARPGSGKIEPGLAHIRHFATDPDWIGRGVGRAIYARCETEARTAGAERFECYSSLNAEGFYHALGFRRERQVDLPMGNGVVMPAVLMRRPI